MRRKKIVDDTLYAVIGIIFSRDGKVLMLFREGKEWECGWEPVKGGIYFGESEEEALLREVKEESGIDVEIISKLPKFYWGEKPWRGKKIKVKIRVFACLYKSGEIKLGEPEHKKWKWMGIEEAKKKIWLKGGDRILEDAWRAFTKKILK